MYPLEIDDTVYNMIGINDGGYGGGNSYRRQRRDSRGRYSREGGGGGGYSYDDGMEEVWEILEMMETGLPDEQREAIRRFRRDCGDAFCASV